MRTGTIGLAIVSICSLSFAFKIYKDNKKLHEELEGTKIATALATEEAKRYREDADHYREMVKKLKRMQS